MTRPLDHYLDERRSAPDSGAVPVQVPARAA
jgi:hypothetical protein